MRVTPQAASQPADGSPPRYGSAVAPEGTAFHTHAGGQAALYLRHLADAELTRNQATGSAAVPHTPSLQNQFALPQQPSPPQQLLHRHDAPAPHQPQLPSPCSGSQPPVADLLQLNVAALPAGLQSPMAAQHEADDADSETSMDMEIVLDQVFDLVDTTNTGRVFAGDAARAVALVMLRHYPPPEVAHTLIALPDAEIEHVRTGLLTGTIAIQPGRPHATRFLGFRPSGAASAFSPPPYRTMTGTSVRLDIAPVVPESEYGPQSHGPSMSQRTGPGPSDLTGRAPSMVHPMQSLATPQSLAPPSRFGLAIPGQEHGPHDPQERARLAMAEVHTLHEWNREAAVRITVVSPLQGERIHFAFLVPSSLCRHTLARAIRRRRPPASSASAAPT